MKSSIDDLVRVSRLLGANPAYVQGGGGNTSVKLDSRWMFVKASGVELKDVSLDHGFVGVDYAAIREYIPNSDEEESRFNAAILAFRRPDFLDGPVKPSIEAGFHATLPKKFVLHSHAIYANILTCSKKGREIAGKLFDEFVWVRSAAPGREVILAFLQEMKSNANAPIVFLENHGFIATGDTADEALERHETVNRKIVEFFDLPEFDPEAAPPDLEQMRAKVFFPDQIVYTSDETLAKTLAARQTFATYAYLWTTLKKIDMEPRFLSKESVDVISNMEAVKYRKKMAK